MLFSWKAENLPKTLLQPIVIAMDGVVGTKETEKTKKEAQRTGEKKLAHHNYRKKKKRETKLPQLWCEILA